MESGLLNRRTFTELNARISIFTNLRLESLERLALQRELDAIGSLKS